jgi:hypothetical protein
MSFQTDTDIGNRALQHCGVPRMDPTLGFSEGTERANEVSFAYGKLKVAELQRAMWTFSTRLAPLRAIDSNTMLLSPALWQSGTTYFKGSLVVDQNNTIWQSRIVNNLGNQPGQPGAIFAWEPYFGPLTVTAYDGTKVYFAGEVVYTAPGDGTYNVYVSKISNNALDPSLPNQWAATTQYMQNQVVQQFPAWAVGTTYGKGATVTYTDGNTYSSVTSGNVGNIPPSSSSNWWPVPVLILQSLAVPAMSQPPITPTSSPIIEWNVGTVYSIGSFAMFAGNAYVSIANANTGNYPNAAGSSSWAVLSGGVQYMSLIDLNTNNNPANAPALWAVGTTYATGNQVGGSDGNIYTSIGNGNVGNNPVTDGGVHWTNTGVLNPWTTVFTLGPGNQQWLQIGGAAAPSGVALAQLDIVWPVGSGPSSQFQTKNVYRLPAGFLRVAPQNPKGDVDPWLGGPAGNVQTDWTYYGGAYFTTWDFGPIIYRFCADVVDVTQFDPMFCEGLAARIGMEVCQTLTQSDAKMQGIKQAYALAMREARLVNSIEAGFAAPPQDEFITVRW